MEATVSPRPEMVASGAMRPFSLILVVALPVVLPLKPLPCSTRPEPSRPRQTVSCTEMAKRELELVAG